MNTHLVRIADTVEPLAQRPDQPARRDARWSLALLLVGALCFCQNGFAAPIPFAESELYYQLEDEPLARFLEGFFAEQGLQVVLSSAVNAQRGTLNGPRSGTPAELFSNIAKSNQIVPYYDGTAVYLFKPQEIVTSFFTVTAAQAAKFRRVYRELGLGDANNSVKVSSANGVITATGTPRFVDQVSQLTGALNVEKKAAAGTTLRYFPLRYAFAGDTFINIGRREVAVPGVASLLRAAVTGQGSVGLLPHESRLQPRATRLRGQGLAADRTPRRFEEMRASYDDGDAGRDDYVARVIPASHDPYGPQIVADTMHNSILIRDEPGRMRMYESLIEVLDVEPQLVEIEATIIDIDKTRLKKLGIDLRIRTTDATLEFNDGSSIAQDLINADLNDNVNLIPALAGLTSGVIVGDSTRFAARLNAMENDDLVSLISSPQVITLNDMEAVIESSREVFVPVGGTYEVDLFEVVAGTVLRVTPHVIEEDGKRKIRIVTTIEDGDVQLVTSTVQRVEFPIVDRNSVTTQAIIYDGQSLLVGGLNRRSQSNSKNEVPGIRRVPLLRKIFKSERKQRESTERLFLITPRLVSADRVLEMNRQKDALEGEVLELLEKKL